MLAMEFRPLSLSSRHETDFNLSYRYAEDDTLGKVLAGLKLIITIGLNSGKSGLLA